MKDKTFHFKNGLLEKQLDILLEKGIMQVEIHDECICGSKEVFLNFLRLARKKTPEVFFDFYIDHRLIDKDVITSLKLLFCSLHFLLPEETYRRPFSKKIAQLNESGLVFGFILDASVIKEPFSRIKAFRNAVDYAVSLYPNDIELYYDTLKPTAMLSSQDIKTISRLSFAIHTFYSVGRAVPWFLIALQSLRIKPSKFFADFSEWQWCNNASLKQNFDPESVDHKELEKMQLLFLRLKYEEKGLMQYFQVLVDIIKIHGSFSRIAAGESEEELFDVSYNPEDLLSPYAVDIAIFSEQVCMENATIHVYAGEDGPDFEIV